MRAIALEKKKAVFLIFTCFSVALLLLESFPAGPTQQPAPAKTKSHATAATSETSTGAKNATATIDVAKPLRAGATEIGRNVLGPNYTLSDSESSEAPRKLCALEPRHLEGLIPVIKEVPEMAALEYVFVHVRPGGRWTPSHCVARHRVAVIVPYRNRPDNLRVFLHHMHQFLRKQELDYGIYIIEQSAGDDFNRAKLLNVGYEVSKRLDNHSCFVFHDIDLIPENDRSIYACQEHPYHLSRCLDSQGYVPSYPTIFGGVSALREDHMEKLNGFSNVFWGWGGEDDDMSVRVRYSGYNLIHANCSLGRYIALKHDAQKPSETRFRLIRRSFFRIYKDGLNSLKYRVLDVVFRKLFTHVIVDLFQHTMPDRVNGAF